MVLLKYNLKMLHINNLDTKHILDSICTTQLLYKKGKQCYQDSNFL